MGETGDPRFTDALRRLISNPIRRCASALCRIELFKATNSQAVVGVEWHVAGRILPGRAFKDAQGDRRGLRRFRDILRSSAAPVLLSEGEPIHYVTYKVSEKNQSEAISVVFVIPRSKAAAGGAFFEGVARCLGWKRPSDLWSILPYVETGDGEVPPPHDPDPAQFTAKSDALAATLNGTPKRMECTDLWTALWRATRPDSGQSRGKRYVIVLGSVEEGRIAGHGLVSNMQGGRIPLQAICSGPNTELREFCKRTRMPFHLGSDEEISEMVQRAYLNLLARYEISYQSVTAEAVPLKVRIKHHLWGRR